MAASKSARLRLLHMLRYEIESVSKELAGLDSKFTGRATAVGVMERRIKRSM